MAELARPETPLVAATGRKVTIRDWYVSNFCDEATIHTMMRIQNLLPRYQPQITRYCEFLSIFGEPPFYTFFIPLIFWVGLTKQAALFCTMMSVTLYFVDNMKDLFACPRPPCPPLRRAGKDSHGMEYGMPSTHTGLGMMCTYHVCLSLNIMFPHATWIIWLGGASFIIQTALSRVYLGLHWPADLFFGAFVFAFSWMLQQLFVSSFIDFVFASNYLPWYLFVLSHIANSICVSPKDPCPCYTDTVRFFGAAAGSTFGGYYAHSFISIIHARTILSHGEMGQMLFTFRFWLETFSGFVVIA
ncbi:sphingosine-1-phosphate phosphatase, putative, partial [Bodo saltans]